MSSAPRPGVLANHQLREAIATGVIHSNTPIPDGNVQPASVDLRLGRYAYQMRCSFLPAGQTVEKRMKELQISRLDLRKGAVLSRSQPYLIELQESVALPPGTRARTNPKSSTGRADVFTRVITDNNPRFDEVADGFEGKLYLEVVPLSFSVRLREGLTLNQLRLSRGSVMLSDHEIRELHSTEPLLHADNTPVEQLSLANGLFLGLDLIGNRMRRVGYRAKGSPPFLDMTQVRQANPVDYWEHVLSETGNRIVLEPRAFYLLMSYEAVVIPPRYAAEMTAYDPTSGELRTHYAGFFDPGFGFDRGGEFRGSTAALEVRAHDVPFMIEHRQPVCKLTFERMSEEPDLLYGEGGGSNYQKQTETLGKHFAETGTYPKARQVVEGSSDQLDLLQTGEQA